MADLGKLFGSVTSKIDDTLEELQKPVSSGAYPLKKLDVDTGGKSVNIFGAPLTLQATASAQARILAPGATIDVFDDATAVPPPQGTSFAELTVDGSVSASGSGSGNAGSVLISATGSSSAKFSYRHALPVSGTRLDALKRLAQTTRLPQMADAAHVDPHEVLTYDAQFNLDFGVKAKFGGNVDLNPVIDLGAGLSLPMKAHAEYTIGAALGFSLYDEMSVTLARLGRHDPNWVRARMQRKHRDEITFGVAVTLDVDYDLQTGADLLLDKIFARIPWPELQGSTKEVLDLAAAGNWDAVVQQLSAKAGSVVTQIVGDTGWKQWVAGSAEVQRFLKLSNFVVNEFDQLDGKVRSFWNELLSKLDAAGLAKVRTLLKTIEAIDLTTLDAQKLVGPQLADVLQLIETLSGVDIEDMIVSGAIGDAVKRAQAEAKKINDTIDGLGDQIVGMLHGFEQRTGLAAVVDWLKANATSVEALQKAGDTWIGSIVQRLVGKELKDIVAADGAKLQQFAQKAEQLLAAKDDLQAKLKNLTKKLQGQFGVKLTLEWSRVSEWSSLVDVEVDPANNNAANALTAFLRSGKVPALVESLTALGTGDDAPYAMHEIVLTSRHVRTSTFGLFLSFLGLSSVSETRFDEKTLRVTAGAGEEKLRTGVYLGGAAVRQQANKAVAEGSAWVRIDAKSTNNMQIDQPYDDVAQSIRLTIVREDGDTKKNEIDWARDVLIRLGFVPPGVEFAGPPEGQQTRFALEINLPQDALEAVVDKDENEWRDDVLRAARVLFNDELSKNDKVEKVLNNQSFETLWPKYPADEFKTPARNGDFGAFVLDQNNVPVLGFEGLMNFVRERPRRFSGVLKYDPQLPATKKPSDVEKAMANGTALFNTHGTDNNIPLFNLWYVLSRVTARKPDALKKATGLATFRTRATDNDDWSAPQSFVLSNGVEPLQG